MVLLGRVTTGFGVASFNLGALGDLICRRTGLPSMWPGTLNVRLEQPYWLDADAHLTLEECNGWEPLALQRCRVAGCRAVIVRPRSHDAGEGHGPAHLEVLAEDHLRTALSLRDEDLIAVATGADAGCWTDAATAPATDGPGPDASPRRLILRDFGSAEDALLLTAALRDLHRRHPGRFVTDVRTSWPDLWLHNPHLTPLGDDEAGVEIVGCDGPPADAANGPPAPALRRVLGERLGVDAGVGYPWGDVHLAPEERGWFAEIESSRGECPRFWLLDAGTPSAWDSAECQRLVDHFRGRIEFVQVGDGLEAALDGVIDLRAVTAPRPIVRLMHHAEGAVSGSRYLTALAGAVEVRPGRGRVRPWVGIDGASGPVPAPDEVIRRIEWLQGWSVT